MTSFLSQAVVHLESALYAVGRDISNSGSEVLAHLYRASDAVSIHQNQEVRSRQGLYSEIEIEAPWLDVHVRQLRIQVTRLNIKINRLLHNLRMNPKLEGKHLKRMEEEIEDTVKIVDNVILREQELTLEQFNPPGGLE